MITFASSILFCCPVINKVKVPYVTGVCNNTLHWIITGYRKRARTVNVVRQYMQANEFLLHRSGVVTVLALFRLLKQYTANDDRLIELDGDAKQSRRIWAISSVAILLSS